MKNNNANKKSNTNNKKLDIVAKLNKLNNSIYVVNSKKTIGLLLFICASFYGALEFYSEYINTKYVPEISASLFVWVILTLVLAKKEK
jgi:hypothetical protein